MELVKYLFRQSWRLMALSVLASLVAGLASTALMAVIARAIPLDGPMATYAWMFVALCLLFVFSRSVSEIALLRLTQSLVFKLRMTLCEKLLATPQSKLQAIGREGLQVILTRDIETFTDSFQALPAVLNGVVMIVASLMYVAWISWQAFFCFVVGMSVCIGGYLLMERWPMRYLPALRDETTDLHRELRSLIDGSRELQLNENRARHFLSEVIGQNAQRYQDLSVRGLSAYSWTTSVGNIFYYQAIGFLLFVLPAVGGQSREVITASALVMLFLIRPISELMAVVPTFRNAIIAFGKIRQLELDLSFGTVVEAPANPFDGPHDCVLQLVGVRHAYRTSDDDQFELGPLDLSVHANETLFIVGGNGSGKTTLAMLLLGLAQPDHGRILFKGRPVTESNLHHYRQNFTAVFADFHLFEHVSGPDREGLASQSSYFLEKFGLAHKVRVEDGKFSSIRLSTGQRKRLALIAAYLEDRPLYLFDEWAADQDPTFKKVFYTEILPDLKRRGKTVIVISHDDAYFSAADRIVKLDSGRIRTATELAVAAA